MKAPAYPSDGGINFPQETGILHTWNDPKVMSDVCSKRGHKRRLCLENVINVCEYVEKQPKLSSQTKLAHLHFFSELLKVSSLSMGNMHTCVFLVRKLMQLTFLY